MNKTETSPSGQITLSSNDKGIYILRVHDEIEGAEAIYLSEEQLEELKAFLNSREV